MHQTKRQQRKRTSFLGTTGLQSNADYRGGVIKCTYAKMRRGLREVERAKNASHKCTWPFILNGQLVWFCGE